MILDFILFFNEIIIAKKNIVTFSIKAYGKQVVEKKKKKKKSPTQDLKNRPDFLGRVSGCQTRILSGRVSGHRKPNPTQPNISPNHEHYKSKANSIFFLKLSRSMSFSYIIFFSSTLLNIYIYIYIYYGFSCIFLKVIFVYEPSNSL